MHTGFPTIEHVHGQVHAGWWTVSMGFWEGRTGVFGATTATLPRVRVIDFPQVAPQPTPLDQVTCLYQHKLGLGCHKNGQQLTNILDLTVIIKEQYREVCV